MRILLVDDDETIATLFATALKNAGYETDHAKDGAEGLLKAKTKPDLILLDQILPDMQGNDILKQLKADEATKTIPVIMLSNFNQEELVKEAINQGALDYVAKYQVEPKDIVEKIKQVIK